MFHRHASFAVFPSLSPASLPERCCPLCFQFAKRRGFVRAEIRFISWACFYFYFIYIKKRHLARLSRLPEHACAWAERKASSEGFLFDVKPNRGF